MRHTIPMIAAMLLGAGYSSPTAGERDYRATPPTYGPPPESKAAARESKKARRQAAWDRAQGVKP